MLKVKIDTYKEEVKKGLKGLDEKRFNKEIAKLEKLIENEKKAGKKDEDILKDLGSSKDYVQKVLNVQKQGFFKRQFSGFLETLEKLMEIMQENDSKANFKIITDLLILLLLIMNIFINLIKLIEELIEKQMLFRLL